jgi:hypothetical protein
MFSGSVVELWLHFLLVEYTVVAIVLDSHIPTPALTEAITSQLKLEHTQRTGHIVCGIMYKKRVLDTVMPSFFFSPYGQNSWISSIQYL